MSINHPQDLEQNQGEFHKKQNGPIPCDKEGRCRH